MTNLPPPEIHRKVQPAPEVADALDAGRPVVALESTLISHGLPSPHNIHTAQAAEAAVREAGAVPATIAVIDGTLRIGLDDEALARLASDTDVAKLSRRDLPLAVAAGRTGATTVAATMLAARLAGIQVFATGGIGGVHRGFERDMDVSADLAELARSDVLVVCSGAKAILDLPRTRELLETLGVSVLGWRCDSLPGFWTRATALPVDQRIDKLSELGAIYASRSELGITSGMLLCNPVPEEHELASAEIDGWIAKALDAAHTQDVRGRLATPFLLEQVAQLSGGRTLDTNVALIIANARLAGQAAAALAD